MSNIVKDKSKSFIFIGLPILICLLSVAAVYFYLKLQSSTFDKADTSQSKNQSWAPVAEAHSPETIVFANKNNPKERRLIATAATLMYQSNPGSGVYDTPVDMTPVRVQNDDIDGWRI